MYLKKIVGLIFIVTLSAHSFSQDFKRGIAVLDLNSRNSEENDSRQISSAHIMEVVGINNINTSDIVECMNYSMILCTSYINANTFSSEEETALETYVSNGGTFVVPRMENNQLLDLFGLQSFQSSKSRYKIIWDSTQIRPACRWIDEIEERTISLGRESYDQIFKTIGYETSEAETLAFFDDNSSAITQNSYGNGHAVTLGFSWKDVILRNQINRDYEAQRITSNGFEPTMDVIMLFVRGLFLEHNPYSVWKNTSPGNSTSTVMITHDIDSSTGMDSLYYFADYEHSESIEGTYNITVKYFTDAMSSDFYANRQDELEYLLAKGHRIESHSVGHFFDFAESDIIPIGAEGNTRENYSPYNDGVITTGATVYGECEVSKNVLENDFGINVRSFRAGHLAYPSDLIEVLDNLGYEYNSSFSACDILTNFPFKSVLGQSFNQGLSSIYEIPATISDVFHEDEISTSNYLEKAENWLQVTRKNNANNAPTVLLIHPNRSYKLEALKHYINGLKDEKTLFMEMGNYGDFWKQRAKTEYSTNFTNDQLIINIPEMENLKSDLSFIVADGQELSDVTLLNSSNEEIPFHQENWGLNDIIIFFNNTINLVPESSSSTLSPSLFPNPTHSQTNLELELKEAAVISYSITNINGRTILHDQSVSCKPGKNLIQIDLERQNITKGIYFVVLKNKGLIIANRKLVVK